MKKAVFLIPYYGRIPDYFDLWAQSAAANVDFDFLIISDLPFELKEYDNIKQLKISFQELKVRIQSLMDFKTTLNNPYKLCEYKPAYGHIFEEYIRGYEFWGFCDVDVILGDLNRFISKEMLRSFDKLWFSGHFTLMRNNDKMNLLYRAKYPNVLDYRFAYTTDHACHFDENGTIAYADEYDTEIRFYFRWTYFDTDVYSYELTIKNEEVCVIWVNGKLTAYWDGGNKSEEFMYIHLQKRKMLRLFSGRRSMFGIMRNEFLDIGNESIEEVLQRPVNQESKRVFEREAKRKQNRYLRDRVFHGWPKYKLYAIVKKWRTVKKLSHMPLPEDCTRDDNLCI